MTNKIEYFIQQVLEGRKHPGMGFGKAKTSTWGKTCNPFHNIDEIFIKEDRKVKLISDVDSIVPEKLKKKIFLIDEIIETNEKTFCPFMKKLKKTEKH